ncbi:hypothetical protein ACFYMW_06795 [Streptomyces sp. NPDC006692]|uniref:hypothetical protein n=1 Tax=Streptomyces sp. NPDC006692 TaxID=3364758 RepID=UPI0036A34087
MVADCPGGGPETGSLSDALAISGPHDRRSSHGVLDEAQELMADAVGAAHFPPLTPPIWRPAPHIDIPPPDRLRLTRALPPRDAFFGPTGVNPGRARQSVALRAADASLPLGVFVTDSGAG